MRKRGFKNYTTQIDAEKSIMEIEYILVKFGATNILKDYDASRPIAIHFVVDTTFGPMPFKLPMDVMQVRQVLINEKKAGRLRSISRIKAASIDHACRVGWRIIKDWIDAQIALLEIEMVKVEQLFLPYLYDSKTQKTFFETLEEGKFAGLLTDMAEKLGKTEDETKKKFNDETNVIDV